MAIDDDMIKSGGFLGAVENLDHESPEKESADEQMADITIHVAVRGAERSRVQHAQPQVSQDKKNDTLKDDLVRAGFSEKMAGRIEVSAVILVCIMVAFFVLKACWSLI